MEKDLLELEEELRAIAPRELSEDLLSRMVTAMEGWQGAPDAEEASQAAGKIIAFPATQKKKASSWHPTWAAAAAVALLGALGATLLPDASNQGVTAMGELGPVPLLRQASLVPVSGERVVSAMNAGTTSDRHGTPYQVIQVVTRQEANFKGDKNVDLKISRPQVETYIVPVTY